MFGLGQRVANRIELSPPRQIRQIGSQHAASPAQHMAIATGPFAPEDLLPVRNIALCRGVDSRTSQTAYVGCHFPCIGLGESATGHNCTRNPLPNSIEDFLVRCPQIAAPGCAQSGALLTRSAIISMADGAGAVVEFLSFSDRLWVAGEGVWVGCPARLALSTKSNCGEHQSKADAYS